MSEQERTMAEMLDEICPCYVGSWCMVYDSPCNQGCDRGIKVLNLYDKGYRKVDGTHYVSMEWHDEQVQHAQDEIENLKLQLQHAQENEEVLTKNDEELKKEAVREYIKSVKRYLWQLADERRCCDDCTSSWMTIDIYEFEEHLDELLEEYDK